MTEQSRAGQSSLNAKRAIQNGVNRFHDALDELEQELVGYYEQEYFHAVAGDADVHIRVGLDLFYREICQF